MQIALFHQPTAAPSGARTVRLAWFRVGVTRGGITTTHTVSVEDGSQPQVVERIEKYVSANFNLPARHIESIRQIPKPSPA